MSTGMFSSRILADEWRGVRGGVSTWERAVDDADAIAGERGSGSGRGRAVIAPLSFVTSDYATYTWFGMGAGFGEFGDWDLGDWGFRQSIPRLLAAIMHAKFQKITDFRTQNGQNGL